MERFIKNHRNGRCKTAQWKWISVKNPYRIIQKKGLDIVNAEVRVMTKPEIDDFRSKGYSVEIVERILPPCSDCVPYIIAEIDGVRRVLPVVDVANVNTRKRFADVAFINASYDSIDKPTGTRGLPSRKNNGVRIKALQHLITQNFKKKLIEEYVVLVKEQAKLTKRLANYGEKLRTVLPDDDESVPVFSIFKPFVDESKLSDCFHCIFQKFFGALPTETLVGYYHNPIDLIAYFFIIVEWEKLGNSIFSEKCKKPFFEYIKEHVVMEKLDTTERTFHNRLTVTMSEFRNNLMKEPPSTKFNGVYWKGNRFIKDFLKVLEIFHRTEYYKEMEKRRLV